MDVHGLFLAKIIDRGVGFVLECIWIGGCVVHVDGWLLWCVELVQEWMWLVVCSAGNGGGGNLFAHWHMR